MRTIYFHGGPADRQLKPIPDESGPVLIFDGVGKLTRGNSHNVIGKYSAEHFHVEHIYIIAGGQNDYAHIADYVGTTLSPIQIKLYAGLKLPWPKEEN